MFPCTARIKKLFLFVLVAKIFILGVFLIIFGEDRLIWADAPTYLDLGWNVAMGNGFSQTTASGIVPNTRFMPLYPALVGFFSVYVPHGLIFISLLQAVAAAGIAVFSYKIGLFFMPHRWALGVALVATFEPLISAIHVLIMPETLFVLFLMGFVYFFLLSEAKPLIIIGGFASDNPRIALMFLVFAAYTKPAALYLIVFPVLFLIFVRKEYVRAGIFAGVFILALVPWMARNASVGGSFSVTNDDTGNICGWTLHGVIATKYGVDPTDWSTTWDKPEFLSGQEQCVSQFSALYLFLTEHPAAFMKTMALSSLSLFTNDGYSVFFEKPEGDQVKPHHNFLTPAVFAMSDWREKLLDALSEFSAFELVIIFAGKLFWTAALFAAIAGIVSLLHSRTHRVPASFITLIILYFTSATAFVTAYGAGARLRYPVAALLIMLAASGFEWLYTYVWNRRMNTASNTIPNGDL